MRRWFGGTLQSKRNALQQMMDAVEKNDAASLLQLVTSLPARESQLSGALRLAVLQRSDDQRGCVEVLLEAGASANAKDGSGSPLLVVAAEAGCTQIVAQLLRHGANVNASRADGVTAVHRTASRGHDLTLTLLLESDATPDVTDVQGRCPLLLAIKNAHTSSALLLLQHGACAKVPDASGLTLLHYACLHGNQRLLAPLLESFPGAVDAQDKLGRTPLMLAAAGGDLQAVESLAPSACSLDLRNERGETALLLAAKAEHLDCLAALVEAGADMDLPDAEGSVPLAHVTQHHTLVARLLELGARADAAAGEASAGAAHTRQADTGAAGTGAADSPLCAAARARHVDAALWLLLGGARPCRRALQLALDSGHLLLLKLLFTAAVYSLADLRWLRAEAGGPDWLGRELALWAARPPALQQLARAAIRAAAGSECLLTRLDALPLPPTLIQYVQLLELTELI